MSRPQYESIFPEQLRASAMTEVLMNYDDHMTAREEIKLAARELAIFSRPTLFRTKIDAVRLNGEVPESMSNHLGENYNSLSFRAEKNQVAEYSDAAVSVTLVGKNRGLKATSQSTPVDFGFNKPFDVRLQDPTRPDQVMSCGDLCFLLDEVIPNIPHRLGALTDPRPAYTFDAIALYMGDFLHVDKSRYFSERIYTSKDYLSSELDNHETVFESGTQLSVILRGDVPTYTLRVVAPYDTAQGRIIKGFAYTFTDRPPRRTDRRDTNLVASDATLTLASTSLRKSELDAMLPSEQAEIEGSYTVAHALDVLTKDLRSFPTAG